MKIYLSILLAAGIFCIGGCSQIKINSTKQCTISQNFTSNSSHPKGNRIKEVMNRYIARGVPGMTVLIHDTNGFWFESAGMADIENKIPMQPCHINKLGSITKMMMGSLIWTLVQEGKLDINAPLKQYLPNVAAKITNGNDITLAMLLNHTSGIHDIGGDLGFNLAVVNDFTKSWTEDEILKYIANKPATNLPGEAVNYSNSNTLLEAMIIEKVTGEQHGELLKERVFSPLGMTDTEYYDYDSPFPKGTLAQGYLDFYNDGKGIQNISNLNPGSGNGYTGVYSTVTDLYKFMDALMVQKTIITPNNLALILGSMRIDDEHTYQTSIGGIHSDFMKEVPDSVKVYGHGGGDIGYSANLDYLPHNQTVFAASYNYGTNLPTALGEEIKELRKELIKIIAE